MSPKSAKSGKRQWVHLGGGLYRIEGGASDAPTYMLRIEYGARRRHRALGNDEEKARARAAEILLDRDRHKALGMEWIPKWERKAPKPARPEKTKPVETLEEFSKDFVKNWLPGKRADRFYRSRIKVIVAALGAKRLDEIRLEDVQSFYTSRKQATSIATANLDVQVLSVMYNRAVEWDRAKVNPVHRLKRDRAEGARERFLYREEAEALLAKAPAWLHPVLVTALHTGLRRANLLKLTWDMVDVQRRMITIPRRLAKGKRPLQIPINDTLHKTLKAIPRHTSGLVFTKNGKAISEQVLKDGFADSLAAAGIVGFRFHDLRHTAASWWAMAGVALDRIQKLLGHTDPRLTQRYAHLTPDYLRADVQRLDTFEPPSLEPREEGDSTSPVAG